MNDMLVVLNVLLTLGILALLVIRRRRMRRRRRRPPPVFWSSPAVRWSAAHDAGVQVDQEEFAAIVLAMVLDAPEPGPRDDRSSGG